MNRTFRRDLDELGGVFSFLDSFAEKSRVDLSVILPVRLAIEELFTNMVRHNARSSSDITIWLERRDAEIVVVIIDHDVAEPFDPTRHRDVDTRADLEERQAGGLGIHLVKRMVDEMHYHYSASKRQSQITLIKSVNSEHA